MGARAARGADVARAPRGLTGGPHEPSRPRPSRGDAPPGTTIGRT
jgi:hypothetical protein